MTTLVLGGRGMLGRALAREFPGGRVLARTDLDVTDEEAVVAAVSPGIALVLNAAADTRVDLAEQSDEHLRTNRDAVGFLASRCAAAGARLVHVSTDYVFDGTGSRPYREDDPVSPVNAYGRGKLEGERAALGSGGEVLVVRTSWVFGTGGTNFVDTILKLAEAGRSELKVVADQTGRPTYAADLARAIRLLVEVGARGVVHFAGGGETTWFELAREALAVAGFSSVAVRPCTTADFPRPAKRPAFSVLDTSLFESLTGGTPRSWRRGLGLYVGERRAVGPTGA